MMESRTISQSQALKAFLESFEDRSIMLPWPRKGRQPGKMLMCAFLAQYLKEQESKSCSDTKRQVVELLQAKGHPGFTLASQAATFDMLCSEVSRMYGIDFNPSSSVMGSVISQEVIKVVT